METATSQETSVPSTEADLNALLGGGTADSSSAVVATEEPAEEVETEAPASSEEEAAEEAGESEGTEEVAETEEAEEEAAEEESEFSLTENDRDYSEAAYKKAAAHYAKTFKVPLDSININDPLTRGLLKETMDRGEALKRQQSERDAQPDKAAEEAAKTETEAAAQPTKPTPEQIQTFIKNAGEVAKSRIIPEVSMHVATTLAKALWGDEAPEKLSQEHADKITAALSEAFWMQLEDALPALQSAVRGNLSQDPVFGRVETMAVDEAAFEHLDGLTDKATGKPLYPNLEQMANSGALKRAIQASPWIKNIVSGNGRDRVANRAAQLDAAYKIARGEQVNPETVRQAVATGKKQATDREKKIAAGRTAPGKTKGEIGKGPSASQQLVSDIVSGGGSKFSAALARDGVKQRA